MTEKKTPQKDPFDEVEQVYMDIAKGMKETDTHFMPRILKCLLTLEEATIVRELPAPFEEVAKRLNLTKEYVETTCRRLVKEGKILQTDRGPRAFNYPAQFGDILLANPAQDGKRPKEYNLFSGGFFTSPAVKEGKREFWKRLSVNGQPVNRVVPRWKAIKDIPGVMPSEDMREILKAYADRLNLTRCVCRTGLEGMLGRKCPSGVNEGIGTLPADGFCIHFGKMAEYFTEIMELTPYLSVDKILKYIEKLDNKATYHMAPNDRDVKWICNCCDCCCLVAAGFKNSTDVTLGDMLSKSRFLALVNADTCSGCEDCVKMCPFHAIGMKHGKAEIDNEKCFGCGTCVINCPVNALTMKIVRPPEHIPEGGAQLVDVEILEIKELKQIGT